MKTVGSMSIRERAAATLSKVHHAETTSKAEEGRAVQVAPIVVQMRRRAIRLLDELLGIDASESAVPAPPRDYFVVIDGLWFSDVSHMFHDRSKGALQVSIWCSYHPGCQGHDKTYLTTERDAWVVLGTFLDTHREGWKCTMHDGSLD